MCVRIIILWVGMLMIVAWKPANAGDFDGTKTLRCQTGDGVEYHREGENRRFTPESVGLPSKFVVHFNKKLIQPTRDSVTQRRSRIKRIENVENKIVLQGAEDGVEGVNDGVGWSMALVKGNGRFTISASGEDVGYIVFGSCVAEE